MRLINKVYRIIRGTANDVADKLDNPLRNVRQAVRDLDTQLRNTEKLYADVMGELNRYQERSNRDNENLNQLNKKAKAAKKNGNESDTRRYISRVIELEKNIKQDENLIAKFQLQADKIAKKRIVLERQYEQCKNQVNQFETEIRSSQLTAKTSKILAGLGDSTSVDYESIKDLAAIEEGKAEAYQAMADDKLDIDSDLATHEAEINERMAALK